MRYECPCCWMNWSDFTAPFDEFCHTMCVKCGTGMTQEERLLWQFQHLDNIPEKHHSKIFKAAFLWVSSELAQIKTKIEKLSES